MKVNFLKLFVGVLALLLSASGAVAEDLKEASEEVRSEAARKKLGEKPGALCLYVKGLCCPSCAIGIRKKVTKLKFVDRKEFSKGVDLDAKTQLVMIGLKAGATPDNTKLARAIEDAGYDPVHLYSLTAGKLATTPIRAKN
ncbi:MAG: hypothetical protein CMO80_02220 [Verrucomicrobiales bacterium]|nr:hypothetical protein [Verrucomicrobiales bacterium]|tara:strand:+ start:3618 stop:4040 length:423 start_codon:yes stop_codon:yes gene_type:complete